MGKKINVSDELHRKLDLICFLNQCSKKDFIARLVEEYLKQHPIPKGFKVTKDFSLEVTK